MKEATARRTFLAGGAALGVLAGVGVAASALNPDADLIRLCSEFLDLQAEVEPILVEFFATPVKAVDELERLAGLEGALWDRQDVLADRVLALRARTQEGMAAKAGVAQGLFLRQHRPEVGDGSLSEELAMVWSLFQDMRGRA